MNTLSAGTEIVCPRKRHVIGLIKSDIQSGGVISISNITFESGQERIAGELPDCKICNSRYINSGAIHTKTGWFPNAPKLEPVAL